MTQFEYYILKRIQGIDCKVDLISTCNGYRVQIEEMRHTDENCPKCQVAGAIEAKLDEFDRRIYH